MDPEASPASDPAVELVPGFELPTARQVVGRGLQLAYEGSSDIRRASLYIGLLVLAVAGPAAILLLVDAPRLVDLPWSDLENLSPQDARSLLEVLGPLYVAASCALLGLVTVSVDGVLLAAAVLGGRAARRPLTLRESLRRGRQVFWRYGFAAFVVGVLGLVASGAIGLLTGALGRPESIGSNLLGSFVSTAATAPFGYVLTAIVLGDVDGAAALGRSVRLARARPRLAIVVAVFAFVANVLQVFGIGAAFEVAGQVANVLHLNLDVAGPGLLPAAGLVAVALVAVGSLALTVSAIAAAPQIAAFLGLTHYSAGLDQARTPAAGTPAGAPPAVPDGLPAAALATAAPSGWQLPTQAPQRRTRWVTIPMLILIGLEAIAALAGVAATVGH